MAASNLSIICNMSHPLQPNATFGNTGTQNNYSLHSSFVGQANSLYCNSKRPMQGLHASHSTNPTSIVSNAFHCDPIAARAILSRSSERLKFRDGPKDSRCRASESNGGAAQETLTDPASKQSEDRTEPEPSSVRSEVRADATPDVAEADGPSRQSSANQDPKPSQQQMLTLEDVNPYGLGRRSRQFFDDVWRRLVQLGQLTRSPLEEKYESVLIQGPNCDFVIPNAEYTTVLVAGGTGRVGRILIRKLLLRGYRVKVLVREASRSSVEELPTSVQVVYGDLTDPKTLSDAVQGCNKIIFCASARSSLAAEMVRVEHTGVANLAKAFLDYNHFLAKKRVGRSSKSKITLVKFSKLVNQEEWQVREGNSYDEDVDLKYDGGMDGEFEVSDKGRGIFKGFVFTRGAHIDLVGKVSIPDNVRLDRFEGILISICGDGNNYSMVFETESDQEGQLNSYYSRFGTKIGFSKVRLPFSAFRALDPTNTQAFDPSRIKNIVIRYEPRKLRASVYGQANKLSEKSPVRDNNSFRLEIHFIKALPGGEETDFILLSCTAQHYAEDMRERVLKAKTGGEVALKNSGLGYTIIRPGPLQEEPGGQRALVFDQGNRITQSISCADVADVCVKSLHDSTARNKSFDVCYEYVDENERLFELVAHLPDKANNYLTPALALLEKNT